MTTQHLSASQFVDRPVDEVFAFFSEPRNLGRLTPEAMGFEFQSTDFDMRSGLEIDYRLRPLLGIPAGWRTRITDFDAPRGFVDVQLKGPYRRWQHRHTFTPMGTGTLVQDEIEYELPFGPLGDAGNAWLVRNELRRIFGFRARAVANIFERPLPNGAPLTVAVAGGTGFVGGAIAQELFRRGERVIVLSQRGEAGRGTLPDDISIREADATVRGGTLERALAGVDVLVISLAFKNLPVEAPRRGRTFAQVDAAGTENLVDAARAVGVKHLVYMSGAGARANAERHWFRAKWRAETALRTSRIPWTIIRPTWVYGPDDVSLNRFMRFAERLPFVPMTNFGGQRLAPVFVDDVARLVADSLRADAARDQTFEIGGPETMTMRDVIRRALNVAGYRRPLFPAPSAAVKLAVAPLVLLPEPPLTPSAVDFVNQPAAVDVAPLLERMPRRLTPFEEGLATYLAPGSGPGHLAIGEVEPGHKARVDSVDVAQGVRSQDIGRSAVADEPAMVEQQQSAEEVANESDVMQDRENGDAVALREVA